MATQSYDDSATPFLVNETNLRGTVVRLNHSLNHMLTLHAYPEPVSRLLGEAIILVSILGETLKFDGIITLQIKSVGAVNMLTADYASGGKIRGYASIDKERYEALDGNTDLNNMLGQGYLAITVDHGEDMERYQGIVSLEGDSISAMAEAYFAQSEQLRTAFNIKIGQHLQGDALEWCGGGIMVQSLPEKNPSLHRDDDWEKIRLFINTVKSDELIDPQFSPKELLYRLFHEDGVWVYDARPLMHQCRCSRERAEGIINTIPEEELEELRVDGAITITCQFCNKEEVFTKGAV